MNRASARLAVATGELRCAALLLFRWRSGNTRYFLPLRIDCGREFIHLLEEHRDFPDLLVLQRGGKARHRREADSMLHHPERRGLGIIFDSIFGKLRCLDIEALSRVRRLGVRCAMTYRGIFGVQVHAGDQILIARLNGIPKPFNVALSAAPSAVLATQLSRAAGLLSAFAGTMPALTAKYPMPASTTSVKICRRGNLRSISLF